MGVTARTHVSGCPAIQHGCAPKALCILQGSGRSGYRFRILLNQDKDRIRALVHPEDCVDLACLEPLFALQLHDRGRIFVATSFLEEQMRAFIERSDLLRRLAPRPAVEILDADGALLEIRDYRGALASLIERCKADDQEAWEELFYRFKQMIGRIAARAGLSEDERAAVYQQVCLSIYRGFDSLEDPARLPGWIGKIARRRTVDFLRSKARGGNEEARERLESSTPPTQEHVVFRAEIDRILHHALSALPKREQRLVVARYFDGMSQKEIADRYGVSRGSIGPTIGRAFDRMRPRLRRVLGS